MLQSFREYIAKKKLQPQPLPKKPIPFAENNNYNIPDTYHVEVDEEGYLKSFSIDQVDEYKKFFNDYGFVIIRDCLTYDQCQNTIDDIWEYVESENWRYNPPDPTAKREINKEDPDTWYVWASMASSGIVGGPPVFTKVAVENRANLNIHSVYANLLERHDLYINHDRYGFFRPTTNLPNPCPKMTPNHNLIDKSLSEKCVTVNNPIWKTIKNLHMDMNIWGYLEEPDDEMRKNILKNLQYTHKSNDFIIENNEVGNKDLDELHIQGLINLADNKEEDGGFILVPGFPKHVEEWALSHNYGGSNRNRFVVLQNSDPVQTRAIRTTARAGSLILWNQKMAHGSMPNNSSHPRFAQFIKMSPSTFWPPNVIQLRQRRIKDSLKNILPELTHLTPLQKKVIGIESYTD